MDPVETFVQLLPLHHPVCVATGLALVASLGVNWRQYLDRQALYKAMDAERQRLLQKVLGKSE